MRCCGEECERKLECAMYIGNEHDGKFHQVEPYLHFGSAQISSEGIKEECWCGEKGNWGMYVPIEYKWIKLYEQAPPIGEEVELKVIDSDGEERIYYNALIPMMNGTYIWYYCDYDDYNVVAWRRTKDKIKVVTWKEDNI